MLNHRMMRYMVVILNLLLLSSRRLFITNSDLQVKFKFKVYHRIYDTGKIYWP